MAQGERELRDYLAKRLMTGEGLLACAYGVERQTRAERLGSLLGASLGSWIGGAFALDAGWGLATTASRLLAVRVARIQRILRGSKLRFGQVQSFADERALGARVERRDRELVLRLALEGQERTLVFADLPGFGGNLQQAVALADWFRSRGGSSGEPGRY
jgi:hypothetical protein